MLLELKGDLKRAPQGALVGIPVNCVGTAGKGMALYMKLRWPHAYEIYLKECRRGRMSTGELVVVPTEHFILAMCPTKYNWKDPASTDLIDKTLARLVEYMESNFIEDVHLPQLGCGERTGCLNYEADVRPLMEKHFGTTEEVGPNAYIYDWN